MILYNGDYEFVGISDSYVKRLNFPSFNAMKYRMGGDFANLFIEKKGFVSNFKFISWIDYIQKEGDKAKAILKSGDNSYYMVTFGIEPYYFLESSDKGYLLSLETMNEYESDVLEMDNANYQEQDEYEESSGYSSDESEYQISDDDSFSFDEDDSYEEPVKPKKVEKLEEESPTFSFDEDDSYEEPVKPKKVDKLEDESPTFSFDENDSYEEPVKPKKFEKLEEESPTFNFDEDDSYEEPVKPKKVEKDIVSALPPLDFVIEKKEVKEIKVEKDVKKSNGLQSPADFLKTFETTDKTPKKKVEKEKKSKPKKLPSLNPEEIDSESDLEEEISYPRVERKQRNIEDMLNQEDIDLIMKNGEDSVLTDHSQEKKAKIFTSENYLIDEVSKELGIKESTLIDFLIDFIHHVNHIKKYVYDSIESEEVKSVKNAMFMVKGLSFNLRISDIYQILDKIYNSNFRSSAELLRDVNKVYKQIALLNKQVSSGGDMIKFDKSDVRPFITSINNSTLPDKMFQDIANSFLKLFDSIKEKSEESLNPESVHNLKQTMKDLDNVAKALNVEEITVPISKISLNINLEKDEIEFDKLVMDWIELSTFIDKLR